MLYEIDLFHQIQEVLKGYIKSVRYNEILESALIFKLLIKRFYQRWGGGGQLLINLSFSNFEGNIEKLFPLLVKFANKEVFECSDFHSLM